MFWDLQDPESAARELISLLEDTPRYTVMCKQARQTYEQRFDPERLADAWMTAILGPAEP